MRDHNNWRSELISEIRTIADTNELRRLWSGAEPQSISSFAEEVSHVFDDYDIDGFIAAGVDKSKLRLDQFEALGKFRDQFAAYIRGWSSTPLTSIRHEQILGDPRWHEVTKSACDFIGLLGPEFNFQ